MKFSCKLTGVLLATLVLSACGGGGDESPTAQVAAADAMLAASATTTAAVVNTDFEFAEGSPSLGTTATTTVSFTNTSTTPAFEISSGGRTAAGVTTFGSCLFTITQSTFVAPSPMVVGNTIRVNPCNIKVNTKGQAANGQGQSRGVALVLGAAVSQGKEITVGVNPGGQITLNGKVAGTVTLQPVTGAVTGGS